MPERVLVVEDNERNRRLVLAVLEAAGMDAETVPTGREAIERCAASDCEMYSSSVSCMPRSNGLCSLKRCSRPVM